MSIAQPRLLLVDNYDSFTYNLVQAFLVLGADVLVYRNDEISVAQALELNPSHLCISPGPGRPDDAGVSLAMLAARAGYVDHAHLARDCRALTSLSPTAFLVEYFPTFPDMADPYKTASASWSTMAS